MAWVSSQKGRGLEPLAVVVPEAPVTGAVPLLPGPQYRALAGVSFPQATCRMTGPVLAVRRADVGQERVRS